MHIYEQIESKRARRERKVNVLQTANVQDAYDVHVNIEIESERTSSPSLEQTQNISKKKLLSFVNKFNEKRCCCSLFMMLMISLLSLSSLCVQWSPKKKLCARISSFLYFFADSFALFIRKVLQAASKWKMGGWRDNWTHFQGHFDVVYLSQSAKTRRMNGE